MDQPRPTLLSRIDAADRRISRRIVAHPQPGHRTIWLQAVHRLSQTGSYGLDWVLLFAAVVTVTDGWLLATVAAGCVVGTLLVNTALKLVVRRPRPWYNPIGERPKTFSMPSAHTSMAIVGASVMTELVPTLLAAWWAWALMLAVSRIILGMHYIGDVVCGVLLGLALASLIAVPLLELAGA